MASSNPKKRPAPGSSPVPIYSQPQMQQFPANTSGQISDAQQPVHNQRSNNTSYAENAINFGMNDFGGNALGQTSFGQSGQSTQLARRPLNRQMVQNTSQASMQMANGPWEGLDTQMSSGGVEDNDHIEALEARAARVKMEAKSLGGGRKQIPPFVQKLSSFLDESRNTDLIRWSDKGDSFIVLDEDEFAKALIPELFKHNNYASFVRQLNMYGFHKRVRLSDNSMRASERKNKSPSEYYHPYFKRGHPNLLWLINKPPKSGSSKRVTKKGPKAEGAHDGDSDDDMDGVEETFGTGYNNMQAASRALSTAPEGQLPKQELALQNQLMQVQRNQNLMFNAIHRLQTEHNDLIEQARRFQELHGRHDNSINAILTFLATIFNRGMDGQNPQNMNISQIFSAGIAQDLQHQQNSNVVDMGDISSQQQPSGSASPHRRAQRLLMGPNDADGRSRTKSPSTSAPTPKNNAGHQYRSGTVEEVFDSNSPRDSTSPQESVKHETSDTLPQQNMMDIINSTNAKSQNAPTQSKAMEFPAMLAQFENANGHAPLSNQQRHNVLSLMNVGGENNSSALTPPAPPTPDFGSSLGYSAAEIDELLKLQNENAEQIENVASKLDGTNLPLSPIPPQYGTEGMNTSIDLDQYLESGAYYNSNSPLGLSGENGEYTGFENLGDGTDFDFGLGFDGMDDGGNGASTEVEGGRILDTPASSGGGSPEDTTISANLNSRQEEKRDRGQRSPSKKRRKA